MGISKNYVYVVLENGSWDYEFTHNAEVYASFETAMNKYKELKESAKADMNDWIADMDESITVCEQIDQDAESAKFEIYETGDFTRLSDTIRVERKEVI